MLFRLLLRTGLMAGAWLAGLLLAHVHAGEVQLAVAANFAAPAKRLAQDFERQTGHRVQLSFGATGSFYAQIRNGAPFDALLAADEKTPARLEQEGLAVAGTRHTYAIGRLVLWSARPGLVDPQGRVLQSQNFRKIALASPRLAPYGTAALQTLQKLGLDQALAPKKVEGAHVAQVYQFVASGNADLGFVALSQVLLDGQIREGSAWQVPADMHEPIRQDAVLLRTGANNPAARAFLAYLRSDPARGVIRAAGYEP